MNTITAPVFFELEIKKSRFIAYVEPIQNKEEAKAVIARLKTQYPDARHICYSFVTAFDTSMNDDGEPSGTAGKPIYNVLAHKNLTNVIAVVVRYFGGIKLGAGGLTRAYGGAISQALELAQIITPKVLKHYAIEIPFDLENKVRHISNQYGAELNDVIYEESFAAALQVEEHQHAALLSELEQKCQGRLTIKAKVWCLLKYRVQSKLAYFGEHVYE